jgi:flagellar assembly protein FliH
VAFPLPPAVSAELEALHAAERALAESEAALRCSRTETEEARSAVAKLQSEHAEAVETMRQVVTAMRDEAERELVKLAIAVAERVVARELTSAPELIVDWAREALIGSALGDQLELALSPALSASIGEAAWGDLAPFVSVDPALPQGTCEVRDGGRVITVDAETRLGLVSDHLATVGEREAA